MVKRIGMVIVGATLVVAHCLIGGAAFAQLQDDGQPCPPECVTDSVGDTDGVRIQGEATLPPSGTLTFNPESYASVAAGTNLYEGTMYYDKDDHKFRYYDNTGSDSAKKLRRRFM